MSIAPWNQSARCPKCQGDRIQYQYVQHLNEPAKSHLRLQCFRCSASWEMATADGQGKDA